MKKILITGPLGQDGLILTELLQNDYELYGICRINTEKEVINNHEKKYKIKLYNTNLLEFEFVNKIIKDIKPDTIINLAGETNVINPWFDVETTFNQNFIITLNLLKSIEKNNLSTYFFQASSSLMYGRSKEKVINENSSLAPIHPYGVSKVCSHNILNEFRYKYGIKGCSGIFFNHESFYRNKNFLSKKLSKLVSEILNGNGKEKTELYNLNYYRDISHAKDFMDGVKIIIEKEIDENFVFSSGNLTNILEFSKKFFSIYNLDFNEYIIHIDSKNYLNDYFLYGDNSKLKSLGWEIKYNIDEIIKDMVNKELELK
jgi:GDPmannose 4,6-dehydratase